MHRRGFVDVTGGQAHYRTCGDPAWPALVMFHGSPGSSFSLVPLLERFGRERYVVALDTRGNGDSTPVASEQPEIRDLALAHLEAIDRLGIPTFDLYGFHTGVSIATEVALAVPERVRRLIFEGISVFDPGRSSELVLSGHAPDIPPDLSGTHLMAAWTMVRDAYLFWPWWKRAASARRDLGLPSAEVLNGEAIEILKSSRTYFRSYQAALRYPKRQRLPLLRHPVLACASPTDQLFEFLDEASRLIPTATKAVLPVVRSEADIDATVRLMSRFLSGEPLAPAP